ncbi:hypothetical protein U4W29_15400, partial [Escherichia coli]|nr:hypothetical protein [Escherichia coli]MDZ6742631.1 hypothetical protein [Escherichia coli]
SLWHLCCSEVSISPLFRWPNSVNHFTCLPEKIGSQKNYRCLAGGIGGVVITEIYCAVIVHIKGMASSELFENILSGDSLVVRIIPALLAGVVMSRIITRLPGLDISCPETDSLS